MEALICIPMKILDPTCSARGVWFDKDNPYVIHCDKRNGVYGDIDITPTVQCDFISLPFPNSSFDMVVFDPPHLTDFGPNAKMAQRYGRLFDDWAVQLAAGFEENWRVLKEGGTLIFKWSDRSIKLKQVLELAPDPLFGHKISKSQRGNTYWITFVKFPNGK